jgi:flagellar protein FlbD
MLSHPEPMKPIGGGRRMIDLTRLNGGRLLVNPDLIKFAEPNPDTTITLVTGEKLIVLESCDDLNARVHAWRASVLTAAWPDAAPALSAKIANDAFRAEIVRNNEQ